MANEDADSPLEPRLPTLEDLLRLKQTYRDKDAADRPFLLNLLKEQS